MEIPNSTLKIPDGESVTAEEIQKEKHKQSPFRNGGLKPHAPLYHNHSHHHHPFAIRYKECLKNHAAALGSHAVDGCGEFMPSPATNPADPTSLKCAACGCHRNFHRREHDDLLAHSTAIPALEYRSNHRHLPPPPPQLVNCEGSPNDSPSPPPISSSYYPSAPQMLMSLNNGGVFSRSILDGRTPISTMGSDGLLPSSNRKRFRTKFTQDQKEKMLEFAEKIGWRIQKIDQDAINDFCRKVNINRSTFKVWMHNNKNAFSKKDNLLNLSSATTTPLSSATHGNKSFTNNHEESNDSKGNLQNHLESSRSHTFGTNGSSSS